MKQVKMITPSGRVLIMNSPDETPDSVEISEVQFELALKGLHVVGDCSLSTPALKPKDSEVAPQDVNIHITGKLTSGYYNDQEASPCVFINHDVLDDLILEKLYELGYDGDLTYGRHEDRETDADMP